MTKIKCFLSPFEGYRFVSISGVDQEQYKLWEGLSWNGLQYLEVKVFISSNIHHVTNLQKKKSSQYKK